MPRENQIHREKRASAIWKQLAKTYPEAHCELNYSNPLELLVATILSAQCTDKQVNVVTADLFRKYRSASDYAESPLSELEEAIRRIGLFRNKAKNIRLCARSLVAHHGGEVPKSMESLVALAGVGRKTANVVLGNAFGLSEGIVVDTHVGRLVGRLRLSPETSPERIEEALMKLVPKEAWTLVSHWLIWHGRRRCGARQPDCSHCEISHLCPSKSE